MTQAEFVERFRHELSGMILDGATSGRTGADLGLFCRQILKKVDAKLVEMYGTIAPPIMAKIPAVNGTATKELASGHAKR